MELDEIVLDFFCSASVILSDLSRLMTSDSVIADSLNCFSGVFFLGVSSGLMLIVKGIFGIGYNTNWDNGCAFRPIRGIDEFDCVEIAGC